MRSRAELVDEVVAWGFALVMALSAARPAFRASLSLGIVTVVTVGLLARWAAPASSTGSLARVALLVGGALVGMSSGAALGFASPLRAFFAQEPGQTPLLVLRGGMLLAAVLASESLAGRARATALGALAALLLFSLCFRALLLPYCAAAALTLRFCSRQRPVLLPFDERLLHAGVLVVALGAWFLPGTPRPEATEPASPEQAVAWWIARENPYQAHFRAWWWARSEAIPGEGYLALARLDVTLGQNDAARRVLARIVERASSNAVRERAQSLAATLGPARNAPASDPARRP